MRNRVARWWHKHAPRREAFENSRILAPIAHRVLAPELWRFTRRSVPRGVALGLLVGIFLMIPGLQIAGAAFLAMPFRANIPLAAAMTFLSESGHHAAYSVGIGLYRQSRAGALVRDRAVHGAGERACRRGALGAVAGVRGGPRDAVRPCPDLHRGGDRGIFHCRLALALASVAQMEDAAPPLTPQAHCPQTLCCIAASGLVRRCTRFIISRRKRSPDVSGAG